MTATAPSPADRIDALTHWIAELRREAAEDVPAATRAALEALDHRGVGVARERARAIADEVPALELERLRARLDETDARITSIEQERLDLGRLGVERHEEWTAAEEALRIAQERFERFERFERADANRDSAGNARSSADRRLREAHQEREALAALIEQRISEAAGTLAAA